MSLKPINSMIACFSAVAVLFFSYIPFIYVFPIIGMQKIKIFILLLVILLTLFIIKLISQTLVGIIRFKQVDLIAFSLYLLFVLYVFFSIATIGINNNYYNTIQTLIIVNPTFIILAFLCRENKQIVIKTLYFMAGIYFVFLILSFLQGNIVLASRSFQNIFSDMEGNLYQNINKYFGLFVVCNLFFLYHNNKYLRFISNLLIPFSIACMLMIGGRAALVAITTVLLLVIFKAKRNWALKMSNILNYMILIILLIILLIIFLPDIQVFFSGSVTIRRLLLLAKGGDSSSRIYLFSKAIELFLLNAKTFLFGSGINGFPSYISYIFPYPHNFILELLSEYGIIGTTIFTTIVIYIFYTRKRRMCSYFGNTKEEKTIFLLFIYYFMLNMFTSGIRSSWPLIFFLFLLIPSNINSDRFNLPTLYIEKGVNLFDS